MNQDPKHKLARAVMDAAEDVAVSLTLVGDCKRTLEDSERAYCKRKAELANAVMALRDYAPEVTT